MTFTITSNDRTGNVEVHITGCAHNRLSDFTTELTDVPEGTQVADVAQMEADRNDGVVFVVAPCARKGTSIKSTDLFANEWTRAELGL